MKLLKPSRKVVSASRVVAIRCLYYLLIVFGVFQIHLGGWAYQVQGGRLKWAAVVVLPGPEQFYNHMSNQVESRWTMFRRYRISPWFDLRPVTTPIEDFS